MMRKVLFGLLVVTVGVVGCGGSSKKGKVVSGGLDSNMNAGGQVQDLRIPKVDETLCDTKNKKIATYDLNHDDKPDIWKLYIIKAEKGGAQSEFMSCKQVDLDHNGKVDMVAQYDIDGNLILEEFDYDYDSHFDARIHYDKVNHHKFLVERDTGYDSKPDLWEEWAYTTRKDENEWLSRILRDRNGDDKPDYWELYKKIDDNGKDSGELESILYDDDFDGKVERRDDAVTAPPPPVAADPAAPADGTAPADGAATGDKPADDKAAADKAAADKAAADKAAADKKKTPTKTPPK